MEITVNVEGLNRVERMMGRMPAATERKATKAALRKGGAVVRKAARANVLQVATKGYATGLLANNLTVYTFRRYRGMLRVGVQVRRGLFAANKARVGLYAAVLEYGKNDGSQEPRSWIRRAAREKTGEVYKVVEREVFLNLSKAVAEAKR